LLLSLGIIHQMVMFESLKKFGSELVRNKIAPCLLFALAASTSLVTAAQTAGTKPADHAADHSVDHYYEPLPQETGEAGLKLMLRQLQTTGRLMQVDAHPDDEDGGTLTLEARGRGVSTVLMTLTRGEGGQNQLGSNLFDVLGVVRTLEVLAADRYYGVEQRFSRVADFGYSKTPEETFQKWQGHDVALADIVRVVRTFRPDVLIARFSGTDRDGHGHHQASAILTKEAFRAAADPNRFPEQIKEGLQPWQPKKLYIGNVCGFGSATCDAANYTVKLNTGKDDPLLGMSYVQFAIEGLKHQESQGLGGISIPKGDRFAFYKLVDSVVDSPKDKDGHEQDFFDGVDTTLVGLASRLGDEEKKVPWLEPRLTEIQAAIGKAMAAEDAKSSATSLAEASGKTGLLFQEIEKSPVSAQGKSKILTALNEKWSQLSKAAALASGVSLHVVVDEPIGASPDTAFMAVPGRTFEVTAALSGAGLPPGAPSSDLLLPKGWNSEVLSRSAEGKDSITRFKVYVPPTAELTRPYWHRNDPTTEALNTVDEPEDQTLPLPPSPVKASGFPYKAGVGLISATCMVRYKDTNGHIAERPLAVAPAFSLLLNPGEQVIPTEDGPKSEVDVEVSSNLDSKTLQDTHWAGDPEKNQGIVRVEIPGAWHVEPDDKQLEFNERGEKQNAGFTVHPGTRTEGREDIRASLKNGHRTYDEGYSVVTREDLGTFYYYQPAIQRVSIVDVKVPKDIKVGYIMGAGDDIPAVLEQIGMNVTLIPADKLATEDLSKYPTIVLGIRAYDTQKAVADNNKRLLDYVQNGGRLVVQYNTMGSFGVPIDFNAGKYTPYPATLSRARVSVEEAPVVMLDPANPIFHFPNEITQKDFEGWVQERGLYFMSQWDSNFTPLLESHDPGEGEQKGGLLVAHYGKGTYIYTGYAFFRQLPAGVPGAVRLFVNLLSRE
jgi:LmbE family N-acetylglucosaminyl deacetylase